MPNLQSESRHGASVVHEANARLSEAAQRREPLELILAVRGTVEPVRGRHRGRWRVRTRQGHVFTFRPEFVVALTGSGG